MTLKAGRELDAEIALICGCRYVTQVGGSIVLLDEHRNGREWSPSSDLNHAFEAAEMVGLFKFTPLHDASAENLIIYRGSADFPTQWFVAYSEFVDDVVGQGETLPLAICDAIVALHGGQQR